MFIIFIGVTYASLENDIPNVCENNNEILIALINVDLPPALGPVNTILFGLSPPISIVLHTIVLELLFLDKYGCHNSLNFNLGYTHDSYRV